MKKIFCLSPTFLSSRGFLVLSNLNCSRNLRFQTDSLTLKRDKDPSFQQITITPLIIWFVKRQIPFLAKCNIDHSCFGVDGSKTLRFFLIRRQIMLHAVFFSSLHEFQIAFSFPLTQATLLVLVMLQYYILRTNVLDLFLCPLFSIVTIKAVWGSS